MKAIELEAEHVSRIPDSRRRQLLGLGVASAAAVGLSACGGGGGGGGFPAPPASGGSTPTLDNPVAAPSPDAPAPAAKSAKRGVAFDLADPTDGQSG